MQVFNNEAKWHTYWIKTLQTHKSIGFVPTMGALHEGHLELIKASKKTCDITVVSIFVNPIQFNNAEDFEKYPVLTDQDLSLLRQEEVDYVFLPSKETIYPESPVLSFNFGHLENVLEGEFRPGHFSGVGIIVSKLFNIIRPTIAFFGQKDLQQVAIIKRLVLDLSFPLKIKVVPTKREQDGLALSSRNMRLSSIEREKALLLINSLIQAKNELLTGKSWLEVRNKVRQSFEEEPLTQLEYFELVHPETFEVFREFDPHKKSAICVASFVGIVRLIDNLSINP
ncbi:pantoate--beta-alanine ligase [Algoriphagus lutimaris]|uniref:pantoate--beta-alanine ligase n=1 Tax=Algoriphagus lutimaris TaxID=613197 RepID=UPI00196A72A2|nr:pantoate--beta-alanine ligase [Algoriphagus lutimaris]MBN3520889.1 pantoate--beta-alanine ligase [Algoriphagus lutimaris]